MQFDNVSETQIFKKISSEGGNFLFAFLFFPADKKVEGKPGPIKRRPPPGDLEFFLEKIMGKYSKSGYYFSCFQGPGSDTDSGSKFHLRNE